MKLHYSPGACSMAPHIVACEAGIPLQGLRPKVREAMKEEGLL